MVISSLKKTKRPNILDFAGKWPGTHKEAIKLKKELEKDRKKFKLRNVNF